MPASARRFDLLPLLLAVETAGLLAPVFILKIFWLLPLVALAALLTALLLRRPCSGALVSLVAASTWWVLLAKSPVTADSGALWPVYALGLGALLSFAAIFDATRAAQPPVARCLSRLVVTAHFVTAGLLFAAVYLETPLHHWLALAACVLVIMLSVDTLLRLAMRLYTPRRHWPRLPQPGTFFFYAWLGADWRACLPERDAAADGETSLKLAEMWMWPALRGSLPFLAAVVALLTWAASCLHEVPAGSSGVRQHFGAWDAVPLEPGLHVSLPWPLGGVQIVDTGRVREVVLGFRADPGQPILWERAHYEEEQHSLVGGGDDLLSISVPVHFRVSRPVSYLRATAEPEALLVQEAKRVLLGLAGRRPAAEIMTTAREELRADFRRRLQTALDAHDSGLDVTDVLLRDVHPPVAVAPAFQEVVSAMEDKETDVLEAESQRHDHLLNARGAAAAMLTTAQSVADNRKAQVNGQTARFGSLHGAWSLHPALYQWREGFRVFDAALGGTKKAIIDETLSARMPAHIDLRKVLNPDLVDSGAPAPQTLVPRPVKSKEAFDLDIEGYLRAGKGDIPAVQSIYQDPDNLLKTTPPAVPKP